MTESVLQLIYSQPCIADFKDHINNFPPAQSRIFGGARWATLNYYGLVSSENIRLPSEGLPY